MRTTQGHTLQAQHPVPSATPAHQLACSPASFQPPTATTPIPAHTALLAAKALTCCDVRGFRRVIDLTTCIHSDRRQRQSRGFTFNLLPRAHHNAPQSAGI